MTCQCFTCVSNSALYYTIRQAYLATTLLQSNFELYEPLAGLDCWR